MRGCIVRTIQVLLICIAIAVFCTRPADASTFRLLVDKSDRTMRVLNAGVEIAHYQVVIGRNPVGHKRHEGDMRTPEGTYRLTKRLCTHCTYKRAFVLDYPNAQDRTQGRTGGGILIHNGVGRFYWWTAGCIALSNADFDKLWALLPTGVYVEVRP